MRRYLLPLVVLGAIGAVIVLLWKFREPERGVRVDQPGKVDEARVEPPKKGFQPAETKTRLDENKWLRELERVLERDDLSRAYYFRGKLCENIDEVLEHGKLSQNLLEDIRKYGIESDDLKRRDVVLPILRVFKHPEATEMIRNEYYRARNEDERMMLLEAMSHSYHDPAQAAVWAVDVVLNSETEENRMRAFRMIDEFSENPQLGYDVAKQVFTRTTRPDQANIMLHYIAGYANRVPEAKTYLREKLKNPSVEELPYLAGTVDVWGDEKDAEFLEGLAIQFPDMADFLHERAEMTRRMRAEERGMTDEERKKFDEKLPVPNPEPE